MDLLLLSAADKPIAIAIAQSMHQCGIITPLDRLQAMGDADTPEWADDWDAIITNRCSPKHKKDGEKA